MLPHVHRIIIFRYLPLKMLISTISALSKQDRSNLQNSELYHERRAQMNYKGYKIKKINMEHFKLYLSLATDFRVHIT